MSADAETRWWQPPTAGVAVAAVLVVALVAGCVGWVLGERSGRRPASAVDIGFLRDMSDHHDQAIEMASVTVANASTGEVRSFAREVLIYQRYEMGVMASWLVEAGRDSGDLDRMAMGWMGSEQMAVPVESMPGMATEEELRALRDAEGPEVDKLFLRLMRDHHLGGIHMAQYAAEHAEAADVQDFARRVAEVQQVEANEYAAAYEKLGYGTLR